MGRYGKRGEQYYRQTAERNIDWLEMNMWLSAYALKLDTILQKRFI